MPEMVATLTKEDYVKAFLLDVANLDFSEGTVAGFHRFTDDCVALRKQFAKRLRDAGDVPGWLRAEYNIALVDQRIDFKGYLYRCGTLCALCGEHMPSDDVTIDHIIEIGLGGPKGIENQQLAHGRCNVAKSADFNKRVKAGVAK